MSESSSLTNSHGITLCRFECWRTACQQLPISEIEAANATHRRVSFTGVAAHVVLPTTYSHHTGQGPTGSLECACAGSHPHSALCPVLHAQHRQAAVPARSKGISVSAAPLFLASSRDSVATEVQVSSTARQAASLQSYLGHLPASLRSSGTAKADIGSQSRISSIAGTMLVS